MASGRSCASLPQRPTLVLLMVPLASAWAWAVRKMAPLPSIVTASVNVRTGGSELSGAPLTVQPGPKFKTGTSIEMVSAPGCALASRTACFIDPGPPHVSTVT